MAELDEFSRLLGKIESNLSALGRRFDKFEERWDERDVTLQEMQQSHAAVANDLRLLNETISKDVKPVTDDVKRWRMMGMGALGIVGIGGAAVGTAALWIWDHVLTKIKFG